MKKKIRAETREKKKKVVMKVTGKSVFAIKAILDKKSKRD
jgi:hypothetical protein